MAEVIADIRAELDRLGVTYPTVPRDDEITVTDHRSGNVVLAGSTREGHLYSPDEAFVLLDRLRELPNNAGLERVHAELG